MANKVSDLLKKYAQINAPGDQQFLKILNAIALAESGGNSDSVGDSGNSIGVFQANMAGGRGKPYTKQQLLDPEFNIQIAMPDLLQGYQEGLKQGLSGAELATYVSRVAQRPSPGNERNAGRNYGRMVGQNTPFSTNEPLKFSSTTPTPTQAPTPDAYKNATIPGSTNMFDKFNPLNPSSVYAADRGTQQSPTAPTATSSNTPQTPLGLAGGNQGAIPPVSNMGGMAYTVNPGDTLWGIAQRYLGNGNRWQEIQGYGGSPYTLPIGQQLQIPTATKQTPPPTFSINQSGNLQQGPMIGPPAPSSFQSSPTKFSTMPQPLPQNIQKAWGSTINRNAPTYNQLTGQQPQQPQQQQSPVQSYVNTHNMQGNVIAPQQTSQPPQPQSNNLIQNYVDTHNIQGNVLPPPPPVSTNYQPSGQTLQQQFQGNPGATQYNPYGL